MISLLVAMDKNHVIGFEDVMPWHLPLDLKYFKNKTMGHTMVMGRKTFESIGRVLPGRKSIVLTRSKKTFPEGVEVIHNLDQIKQIEKNQPDEELFVIGGGEIFKQALPLADRMYITLIDDAFEGDTFFPVFSESKWTLVDEVQGEKNDKNPYNYTFLQYDRK